MALDDPKVVPKVVEAADRLAYLYYLPAETGQRVMHFAHDSVVNGKVHSKADLRRDLGRLYSSTISDGFATDVLAILRDKLPDQHERFAAILDR